MSAILCEVDAISHLFTTIVSQKNVRLLQDYMLRARTFAFRNQLSTLLSLQRTCKAILDVTRGA
jgi:hypothetical protein